MDVTKETQTYFQIMSDAMAAFSMLKKKYIDEYRPYFLESYLENVNQAAKEVEAKAEEFSSSHASQDLDKASWLVADLNDTLVSFSTTLKEALDAQISQIRRLG